MKAMQSFAVIGLGRFGRSIVHELSKNQSFEVLAIDEDESNVEAVKEFATNAAIADATDESIIRDLEIESFDAVIVSIGDIEDSVLVTLLCKRAGAKYIIAKAISSRHKTILEKLGADVVIIPEYEMGKKVATMLSNPGVSDIFDLGADFSIIEFVVPSQWAGQTIIELDLRRQYEVNVILIKRGNDFTASITPDTIIWENDILAVAGNAQQLHKLTSKVNKMKD